MPHTGTCLAEGLLELWMKDANSKVPAETSGGLCRPHGHSYAGIYLYMYGYTYAYMIYVYIHIHIYIYTFIHIYKYTYRYMSTHTSLCVCVCVCVCECVCDLMCIYGCMGIHAHVSQPVCVSVIMRKSWIRTLACTLLLPSRAHSSLSCRSLKTNKNCCPIFPA